MSCVAVAVNLPFFALDLQIILLHILLRWRGMSTYEYILYKIEVEEERSMDLDASKPNVERLGNTFPRFVDWIVYQPSRRRSAKTAPLPETSYSNDALTAAGEGRPPLQVQPRTVIGKVEHIRGTSVPLSEEPGVLLTVQEAESSPPLSPLSPLSPMSPGPLELPPIEKATCVEDAKLGTAAPPQEDAANETERLRTV